MNFMSVRPAKPATPYIGGKRLLARRIIDLIDATDHDGYCEPFVGMGGVFLRRRQKPRTEVINDISGDITDLFRILQRHYPQFMDMLRFQVTSRDEFQRSLLVDPKTLTDLERAARFLYLQRLAFGGKVRGQSFGVVRSAGARFNARNLAVQLERVHERLAGVIIENLPWKAFIERYDRPKMLFYLDPPYWDNESDYGNGIFSKFDFEEMAATLARLQGRFILSINNKPQTQTIFDQFQMTVAKLNYSVAQGNGTVAEELIIKG